MEPQHECPICLEKFLLSSTLVVHKMQMHLSDSEGKNACNKISTFLLDLLVEESLYCSDEDSEYTFTFITNVKQMPKRDIKSENHELLPNDWVQLEIYKTDSLTDDYEEVDVSAETAEPAIYNAQNSLFNLKRNQEPKTDPNLEWTRAITKSPKDSKKSYSKCRKCDKIVLTNSLKEHLKNSIQCRAKNSRLPSKAPLSSKSANIENYKCSICNMKFVKERALILHQMSMHRPENETEIALIASGTINSTSCMCTLCNTEFADRKEVFGHLRLQHKTELNSIDSSIDKYYACDACPKTFKPFLRFASHSRNAHFNNLTALCSICGQGYGNATRLRSHIRSVHTGERPYECEQCGKRFNEKRTLTDHLGLHTGERPFVCLEAECIGRAYAQKSGLRQHQLLAHKGAGRYQCHVCDKRFTLRRFHT